MPSQDGMAGRLLWTIGYGHLCDATHPPITEVEAEVYLARDLQSALAATLRYCPVLAIEPVGRLAAIVDFTFNLGAGRLQTSTLRRRINQRDWPDLPPLPVPTDWRSPGLKVNRSFVSAHCQQHRQRAGGAAGRIVPAGCVPDCCAA